MDQTAQKLQIIYKNVTSLRPYKTTRARMMQQLNT